MPNILYALLAIMAGAITYFALKTWFWKQEAMFNFQMWKNEEKHNSELFSQLCQMAERVRYDGEKKPEGDQATLHQEPELTEIQMKNELLTRELVWPHQFENVRWVASADTLDSEFKTNVWDMIMDRTFEDRMAQMIPSLLACITDDECKDHVKSCAELALFSAKLDFDKGGGFNRTVSNPAVYRVRFGFQLEGPDPGVVARFDVWRGPLSYEYITLHREEISADEYKKPYMCKSYYGCSPFRPAGAPKDFDWASIVKLPDNDKAQPRQ